MSKVYIFTAPEGRYNTEHAVRYGRVEYVEPKISLLKPDEIMDWLSNRLIDFDPEHDHLAMTGQNLVMALAVAYVIAEHGRASLLLFDPRTSRYAERVVHYGDTQC